MLFPEYIGESLRIDEAAPSNGELYTVVTPELDTLRSARVLEMPFLSSCDRRSTNIISPSVDDRFSAAVNSSTFIPAVLANLAGSASILLSTVCIAVADFSTLTRFASRIEPNASISSMVMPVEEAIAPIRLAKSTILGGRGGTVLRQCVYR